jgi:inner membrane protein
MLFAMLAAVMVVTRKVDWYKGGSKLMKVSVPPTPIEGLGL